VTGPESPISKQPAPSRVRILPETSDLELTSCAPLEADEATNNNRSNIVAEATKRTSLASISSGQWESQPETQQHKGTWGHFVNIINSFQTIVVSNLICSREMWNDPSFSDDLNDGQIERENLPLA
jgi:hypothetical protein